ncbi:MAG: LPXTG cell wall anchor domain-containing protein [Chloroflexota bacterium]
MTWDDLTSTFGELPPGEVITVTTVFRAIRAEVATINRARIEAAQGSGGESGGGEDGASSGEAEGGQVVVTKALAQDSPAVSGQPITFTISIRNDGAADIVSLPLEDTPNTEFLQFIEADPPPSSVASDGAVLRWDDVLPDLGLSRLRPDEVITVTTVFTALKSFEGTGINNSNAVEVQDEFGNEVEAPRQDEVPIRILPGPDEVTPTAMPEPAPPRDDDDDDDGGGDEPAVTPEPTATTVVVTPTTDLMTPTVELTDTTNMPVGEEITPTVVTVPEDDDLPAALPETGRDHSVIAWLLLGVALASVGVLVLLYRRRQMLQ